MAKNDKSQLSSPEVVFPEGSQPDAAPEVSPTPSIVPGAVPPTINGIVNDQLAAAIKKSGDQLAALQAQTALAQEAHNKNLGMALLMEQLQAQGLVLTQIPRQ